MNRKMTTLATLFAAGAFAAHAGAPALSALTAKSGTDLSLTEVNCSADKKDEKKDEKKDGKCGAKKDGKCGAKKDGKCGGEKKKGEKKDGSCGKGKDGSCGKGSCGSKKG